MSLGCLRFSCLVVALLGSLAGSGHAQSLAPPAADSAAPGTAPAPSSLPAGPTEPAQPTVAPAPPTAAPAPPAAAPAPPAPPIAPDPATVKRAIDAKAAGKLIENADRATVVGCRDLGQSSSDSALDGVRGRARIRVELREAARARGASHVRYFGYVDGIHQREQAQFYDCAGSSAEPTPRPLAAGVTSAPPRSMLSGQLEILPFGSLKAKVLDMSTSADAVTTFGLGGNFDYAIAPVFSIGAAPRLVLGLKSDGDTASATELDLGLRARFGHLAGDEFGIHGYVSVGGSWIYLPNSAGTSSGATLGFGVGAILPLRDSTFLTFEAGYQLGGQSVSVQGTEVDLSSNLLHVAVGYGTYL